MGKIMHPRTTSAVAGLIVWAAFTATNSSAADNPNISGAELFAVHCASCHGGAAHGDGPIAPVLNIAVPDLTLLAARNGNTFPAKRVRETIDGSKAPIAHGTREMPIWTWELYSYEANKEARARHAEKQVTNLVDYLASIQRPLVRPVK